VCACFWCLRDYLAFSGVIGSEFLPTWMKAHSGFAARLRQHGPDEGIGLRTRRESYFVPSPRFRNAQVRWAPDDGRITPASLTPNICGLKPKEQWRPVFQKIKKN